MGFNPKYRDKFVAFIDILGFKQLVEHSETDDGIELQEILDLLKVFGEEGERAHFERYGPIICPRSLAIEKHLDFRLTQVSDCVIVSAEISPAGVINLLSHCKKVAVGFLVRGVMCRGYVTRGKVFHTEKHIIGTGYQTAYESEAGVRAFKKAADERGTPFIEVDTSVVDYVVNSTDECVQKMFGRMVKSDGELSAIFPFDPFSHSLALGSFGVKFDPVKEHQSNDVVRSIIKKLKQRIQERVDPANLQAVAKAQHYLSMLDEQLDACDKTDEMIDVMCQPFPRRSL